MSWTDEYDVDDALWMDEQRALLSLIRHHGKWRKPTPGGRGCMDPLGLNCGVEPAGEGRPKQ